MVGARRPHWWAGCSANSTLIEQPGDKPDKTSFQLLIITLNGAADGELVRVLSLWAVLVLGDLCFKSRIVLLKHHRRCCGN